MGIHQRKSWIDNTNQQVDADWLNSIESYLSWLQNTTPLGARYKRTTGTYSGVTSTLSSGTSMTGVGSIVYWNVLNGQWRWCGMTPTQVTGDPSAYLNNNNGQGNNFSFGPVTVEFWSNATQINAYGYMYGKPDVWATVNGQPIAEEAQHYTGSDGAFTWKLEKTGAVWRRWKLCMFGVFNGLAVNSGAKITESHPIAGGQVAFVGDSWVHGGITMANSVSSGVSGIIGATSLFGTFERKTQLDVWRCGLPGTGFLAQGGYGVAGPYNSTTRMARLNALPKLNMIATFGSVNDLGNSPGLVAAAANSTWTAIKAGHPEAELVAFGLELIGETPTSNVTAMNNALKAAATDHPDVSAFVDLVANPFLGGTGVDGTPSNDGNSDFFLGSDYTHLTHQGSDDGGEYIMELLAPVRVSV